jgi:hypothetical protein
LLRARIRTHVMNLKRSNGVRLGPLCASSCPKSTPPPTSKKRRLKPAAAAARRIAEWDMAVVSSNRQASEIHKVFRELVRSGGVSRRTKLSSPCQWLVVRTDLMTRKSLDHPRHVPQFWCAVSSPDRSWRMVANVIQEPSGSMRLPISVSPKRVHPLRQSSAAIVDDLRSQAFTRVRTIAAQLNERGILTPCGGAWHPTSAARLLSRLQAIP